MNTIAPQATDSLLTWLNYWGHVHVTGIDLGLERVIPVAQKLNVTQTSAKVITVAGTNGKGSTTTTTAAILQQAAKLDYHPTFFGCDGLDGILGVEGFDKSLAEGTMLLTPYASDAQDEKTQTFTKAYEDKYGDTPIQFAADAYDAIYAIKAAIEEAGVTPDMSVSDIGTALTEAMTKISVDGLTGDGMTWEATGEVSKAPKAMVIKDGAYTAM